jgi:hypothetical protein
MQDLYAQDEADDERMGQEFGNLWYELDIHPQILEDVCDTYG